MSRAIDAIIGKTTSPTGTGDRATGNAPDINATLATDAAEPETYRPYHVWPYAQLMFSVIERDGTEHGFQYHTLRHPKLHKRNDQEFLSFTADGLAVLVRGTGLRFIYLALKRYALSEMREYDGKPPGKLPTRIDELEVVDAQEQLVKPAPARLVK